MAFCFSAILAVLIAIPSPKRVITSQSQFAKQVYHIDQLTVYCEEPTGNLIYVTVNPVAGGAGVFVIPGGCK